MKKYLRPNHHFFLLLVKNPLFFRYLYIFIKLFIIINRKKSGKVGKNPENPRKYVVFAGQIRIFKSGQNRAFGQKIDQNQRFLLFFSLVFLLRNLIWSKNPGFGQISKHKSGQKIGHFFHQI